MSVTTRPEGEGAARLAGSVQAVLLAMAGLAVSVAAWWVITDLGKIQKLVLPSPPDVVDAFIRLPGVLMESTIVTLIEIFAGFGIATAAGLLVGIALSSSRLVERMFYPVLVAFNAVPKIALGPLLIMWMGFDQEPKVVMVILICFFPIVLAAATGLTTTPSELAELARSLDASWWQAFRKVRFPNALAQIFVGLKVAMPLAVIGAVVAEFLAGSSGLGYVIISFGAVGDTAMAFAAIVMLAVISIALFYALVAVERLLLPWVGETTSR